MNNELTTINEKYLYALSTAAEWLTVSEWALKVAELFPDLLANAEAQAANQKNDTTGLREIAARLSSRISSGGFGSQIEVDASERPKKVRFLTAIEQQQHEAEEVEEYLAPLRRIDIIKRDSEQLSVAEQKQYIEAAITLQTLVASRMSVEVETHVKASLLSRLEAVY